MYIDKETGEITMFLRTPYNYNTDNVSRETGTTCEVETKTQQQFKDETDINTIVDKFMRSGEPPPTINWPEQTEFMETFDYQTAMNATVQARESFMELPAKTRARFQNDPQQFLEFMYDGNNQEEAIKMGLATRKPPPTEPIKEKEKE